MKPKYTYARSQIESEIITISPATAATMLATMPAKSNRKLRLSHAEMLADLIRRDAWHVTHCGIAFNQNGHLIDGQHRLTAITLAERPVQVMVTYGLPAEMMVAVDRGSSRSIGDVFHLVHGIDGGPSLTSICAVIQKDFFGIALPQSVAGQLEVYRAYKPGLDWAVQNVPNKTAMNKAPYRAAMALAHMVDGKATEEFYERYHTGAGPDWKLSAVRALREFTIRVSIGKKEDKEKPGAFFQIAANALVAHMKGEQTAQINRAPAGVFYLKTALKGGAS